MDPESLLVERLLDRSLLQPGEAGEVACAEVVRAYREALSNLTVTPRQFDSVRAQWRLLFTFCRARHVASGLAGWQLAGDRLFALGDMIDDPHARSQE